MKLAFMVALVAGALALSGCGDDNTKTVVSTQTVTRETTTEPDSSSSTTSSKSSNAPVRIVHRSAFQSPTGNIGCMIIAGEARCDIGDRSWSAPRPDDCPSDSDFGQGLEVGRSGKGGVVCAGDTARDSGSPKLPYGTGSQVGGFTCVSRSTGITCTSRRSGHGFSINAERYRLF